MPHQCEVRENDCHDHVVFTGYAESHDPDDELGLEQCPNPAVECVVYEASGKFTWMCAKHWDQFVGYFHPKKNSSGQWRLRTGDELEETGEFQKR